MAKFCGNCGTELQPTSAFCPNCGNAVSANTVAQNNVVPKKKSKSKVIGLVACLLVVAIVTTVIIVNPFGEGGIGGSKIQAIDPNQSNNIVNGGRASLYGDKVFYFNDCVFECDKNFENIEAHGITNGRCMNVYGDYIYFTGNGGISKYDYTEDKYLKVDFCDYSASNLLVYDNYAYFISDHLTPDIYGIYRVKLDGTNVTCLFNGDTGEHGFGCFNIYNDIIYFTNADDNNCIYKMNLDGTELAKFNNQSSNSIVIEDDWIYYVSEEKGNSLTGGIYKINVDGTGNTMVSDVEAYGINVYKGYIYYVNYKDNQTIHRMSTDGTGDIKLSYKEDCFSGITICNDVLFFKAYVYVGTTGTPTPFHINLDGSDCEALNNSRD